MIILHLKSYLNVDPLDVGLFLHNINTLLKCVKYSHQHFTVTICHPRDIYCQALQIFPALQTDNDIMMLPVE